MSSRPAELSLVYLCQLLRDEGLLSEEQVRELRIREPYLRQKLAKEHASTTQRYRVSPVEVVLALDLTMTDGRRLTEDRVAEVLAKDTSLPFTKLDPLKLDAKLVTETFSRAFARHNLVLPIRAEGNRLLLGIADPYDLALRESLRRTLQYELDYVVVAKSDLLKIITDIYGFRSSVKAAADERDDNVDLGNLEQYVAIKRVEEIEATDAHIVNAVDYLMHYAFDQRASDIHIEPKRELSAVRLRIDGILHRVYQLPKVVHAPFVSRLKMMARLDIAEKRKPQDGRIKIERNGREIELRVSTMPVAFGEKIVIRVLDTQYLMQEMSSIGLEGKELKLFESFLSHTTGLILVTGPTGSGKTTTLYSGLRFIASPEVNIITIEDPIEMVYEHFNQVQVQSKIGVTFSHALRNALRQDPDIIMVGEIRDAETAQMAVQAALTGHLVLSTLHTNDAPTAVTRMLDLGVQPFLLASTLIGVVAQRLLRSICPECKATTQLTDDQIASLDLKFPAKQKRRLAVRYGSGCAACRYTGLMGRSAVFEVMPVNENIRRLVHERADAESIMKSARADGMLTLKEVAIRKMAQGETTFDEVLRLIGST